MVSNVRQRPLANREFVGEIVLNDFLPNGSGFVAWVESHWKEVLQAALNPSRDGFARTMLSDSHRRRCEASCPDCLRHYRNMTYHGLLDWRLGLAVLRLLNDPAYQSGLVPADVPELTGPDSGQNWQSSTRRLRDAFCSAFPNCAARDFGPLCGFTLSNHEVLIIHPLWNTFRPHGLCGRARRLHYTSASIFGHFRCRAA